MAKVQRTPAGRTQADFDQTSFLSEDQNDGGLPDLVEGYVLDVISGERQLKETPKEVVRQRIARALFHEDGISYSDMEADFLVKAAGKRYRVDIAIFHAGTLHTPENVSRAVVCRPEPSAGRNVVRIRDHQQAEKDLEELKDIMSELPDCKYGLWTNGLDLFYLEKEQTKFEVRFHPVGYWPPAGESFSTFDASSRSYTRKADKDMLRTAFRRCHNFIHGNEGMPKDAAFWQFLYLIFCKIYDEQLPRSEQRFWISAKEQFDPVGRQNVRRRISELFEEVKDRYKGVFRGNEEITLSDRAIAFMVSELARYNFLRTDVDAKGAAYQEIVGTNLRGDRGQYFTPRGVVNLAVEILAPHEHEVVMDPACGTGGFLTAALAHMLDQFRGDRCTRADKESTEEFIAVSERLSSYARSKVFGADFDPFLIKASQMNMVMSGDGRGHLYNINSLEFPLGYLPDLERARRECPLGSVDIVMTNPPFGSDIPIVDRHILEQFQLAQRWEKVGDGSFRSTGELQAKVAPEVLFIERCVQWLKPGGRMAIVLPNGILGNPAAEYIRWWILRHTWVLASVDLPVEVFIVEANVNILTSLLFLKKKTDQEIQAESIGGPVDYPVFMAVAEKVGVDRRGNVIYKRNPDGTDRIEYQEVVERSERHGAVVERTLRRPTRVVDDDLPAIAEKYRSYLHEEAHSWPHLRGLVDPSRS